MKEVRSTRLLWISALLLLGTACAESQAPSSSVGERLVLPNATWRHSISPTGETEAWAQIEFDDNEWAEGPAPLGYGESGLATETQDPTSADPAHLSVYFRHSFDVEDPSSIEGLTLRTQWDDGLRVLLNGQEWLRHHLPVGDLRANTRARRVVSGEDEERWRQISVDVAALRQGRNVLAVEVHQERPESSDLRFAAELIAHRSEHPLGLLRGPYLQQTHASGAVLRFETNRPAVTWVAWGPAPDDLSTRVEEKEAVADHEVRLAFKDTGPLYYAVGVGNRVLAGGDEAHRILRPQSGEPVRAWITGDQGSADEKARKVLAGMHRAVGSKPPQLWITLGDNAYPSGTRSEFQAAVFDTFGALIRSTTLWPSPGNHDFTGVGPDQIDAAYFNVFTLPTAAEAGGVASGSERYYSFDWGPLHVVSLDTISSHRHPDAPMLDWLKRDLAAARPRSPWLVAAFHHPPYSRGSHDSSEEVTTSLVRENVVPILEAHGVDLVLAGHSHNYERSRVEESPVYVVAGNASIPGRGPLDHPKMVVGHEDLLGSLLLDVDDCRLEVRAIDAEGEVYDRFELERAKPCSRATSAASVLP